MRLRCHTMTTDTYANHNVKYICKANATKQLRMFRSPSKLNIFIWFELTDKTAGNRYFVGLHPKF